MAPPSLQLAPALEETITLLEGFALESLEALDSIEASLLCLDQQPWNAELLPQMLRPLHTLRSNAATLELKVIYRLSHTMESIIDWHHRSPSQIEHEQISLLLKVIDRLRWHCHGILQTGSTSDHEASDEEVDGPEPGSEIRSELDAERTPGEMRNEEGAEQGTKKLECEQIDAESDTAPDLDDILNARLESSYRQLREGLSGAPPLLGEILIQEGKVKPEDVKKVIELQNQPMGALFVALGLATPENVTAALAQQQMLGHPHLSIRVETRRLERLKQLSTTLLATCSGLRGRTLESPSPPDATPPSLAEVRRIARLLWGEVANLRQTPLLGLFQRLTRTARDLADQHQRKLSVAFSGETTELEVEYVEALSRVLPHAIRNAIVHGIEPEEERRTANKPAESSLRIIAIRENDQVILAIADDGRGLDPALMSTRARELGFHDSTNEDEPKKWNVLFEQGFSTRASSDGGSGRGIGLNAIRDSVDRLGGQVWLESTIGRGTCLLIRFPTRAGNIEGVVVTASGMRFVIPSESVLEYARPTPPQCRDATGPDAHLRLRGKLVPLVWLAVRTGRPPPCQPLWESLVIVVSVHGSPLGLVVDDLIGPQRVPAVHVTESSAPGLPGKVVLEDGEVAELVALDTLFSA